MVSDNKIEPSGSSAAVQPGIIGHIKAISRPVPPENWALCDGSELFIKEYPALYAVIGARFGGDGVTTFALPNLPGEPHFAICLAGYFPLEGVPLPAWKPAPEVQDYIGMRARAFQESYAQGGDPFFAHRHASELDPEWLERQGQVLKDAYARGHDPHHRHPPVSEVDPEWLERQVQVMLDAYGQGLDPLHRHPHVSEIEPAWFERQGQVLKDGYARGHDPHHRHPPASELDPGWLERQVQVLKDGYSAGADPLHRHPHGSEVDPEWLERQAQVMKDAHARHSHPLERHPHLSEVDPEWLERQVQLLQDAHAQDHDPHHRHPHLSELDPVWVEEQALAFQDAYARGEDPLAGPAAVEPAPDDLRRIEGIGPKISGLLQQAGITTFAELAVTELDRLKQILQEAGIRFASPATWPEQAELAAAGQWADLAALQQKLKGGRR